jgi:hypothetical protein
MAVRYREEEMVSAYSTGIPVARVGLRFGDTDVSVRLVQMSFLEGMQ